MFGLGVAVGDYDNDGYDDLFLSALGQSHLFHNNGNGTFTEVTKAAGLWGPQEFSTSAAWVDYDRDGKLDLVVANYVQWSIAGDLFCTLDGTRKSYCTPESYKGSSARLWHNLGNGKFEDATQKAGFYDPTSKSLGIAILDYNGDGWPDVLLANDTQPNKLYLNKQNGTFEERALSAGIAFSEDGVARAGMGADAGDYDRSGHPSIIITNFANQMLSLYHNEGNGLFVDEAPRSEVGRATLVTLGFGCFFFDYDNEGNANHSLRIKLVGTKSNRDGIGAVVRVASGGDKQWQMLKSGSSYLSQSELVLTFGLGEKTKADSVEIQWPSGQVDKLSNISGDQTVTIEEGRRVISSRAYAKRKAVPKPTSVAKRIAKRHKSS